MKIISTLIIVLSLALPAFCQQLSQADANQILTVAKKKYRLPSVKDYYSAEDYAFMQKISELRQKLIKDNQDKPADLIAQATEYLNAEKALLKNKPVAIYKWLQGNTPIVLDTKNQRGFLQIKSSDGAIDIRMRADDLAAALGALIDAEITCWTSQKSRFSKDYQVGALKAMIECQNPGWTMIYLLPNQSKQDAFGRKKQSKKDDVKYYLTNENLRAWYVQVAEMSAKYKAAPALMD